MVVQHGEALIFSPSSPEVLEFVPALQQQIAQIAANDALLTQENGQGDSKSRFEHIVIEAALNVVCTTLFRHIRTLSPAVDAALKGLRQESLGLNVLRTQVDELLPLKNKIDELRKRVKEIKRAITEVLNNDEDLAMMYLRDVSVNTGGVIDDSTPGQHTLHTNLTFTLLSHSRKPFLKQHVLFIHPISILPSHEPFSLGLTTSSRNIIGAISSGVAFTDSVSIGTGGVPILRPPSSDINEVDGEHGDGMKEGGETMGSSGGSHNVKANRGLLGASHRGVGHGISTSRAERLDIADTMNLEV